MNTGNVFRSISPSSDHEVHQEFEYAFMGELNLWSLLLTYQTNLDYNTTLYREKSEREWESDKRYQPSNISTTIIPWKFPVSETIFSIRI